MDAECDKSLHGMYGKGRVNSRCAAYELEAHMTVLTLSWTWICSTDSKIKAIMDGG